MGYAVLWLGYLAVCFLLIATIAALGASSKRIVRAGFWPKFVFVVLFFVNLGAVVAAGFFWTENIRPIWLFPYALFLFICFTVGSILILRKGLKKSGDRIAASNWPGARLAGALGIVFCITVGTLNVMDVNARVDQARLQAQTAGKALSMWPARLPDHLNAGNDYNQASVALSGRGFWWTENRNPREKKKPDWFSDSIAPDFVPASEDVVSFLKDNREALALLRRAGDKPGLYYEVDSQNLVTAWIPSFSSIRDSARLLGLSAKLKAVRGEPEAALAELAAMEKMTGHLYGTPTLMSQLIAAAIEGIRASTLEFVLAQTPFPQEGLVATPIKPSYSITPFFQNAMRFEDMASRQVFASIDRQPGSMEIRAWWSDDSDVFTSYYLVLWRVFLFPDDLDSLAEIQNTQRGAYEKPWPQGVKVLNDLESGFQKRRLGLFTKIWYFMTTGYYTRIHEAAAQRSLIDLALAATAYKAASGDFPASLDALVPEYIEAVPGDPFDGKAMKLKAVDGGLDIYSVGAVKEEGKASEAIHFYLGTEAYDKYRYRPALEEREKAKARKKKK